MSMAVSKHYHVYLPLYCIYWGMLNLIINCNNNFKQKWNVHLDIQLRLNIMPSFNGYFNCPWLWFFYDCVQFITCIQFDLYRRNHSILSAQYNTILHLLEYMTDTNVSKCCCSEGNNTHWVQKLFTALVCKRNTSMTRAWIVKLCLF